MGCNNDCFNCTYSDCICSGGYEKATDELEKELELEERKQQAYKNGTELYFMYNHSKRGKERAKKYNSSDKGKAARDKYNKTEKGKERWRRYYQKKKAAAQAAT